jgi:hypothetical protein
MDQRPCRELTSAGASALTRLDASTVSAIATVSFASQTPAGRTAIDRASSPLRFGFGLFFDPANEGSAQTPGDTVKSPTLLWLHAKTTSSRSPALKGEGNTRLFQVSLLIAPDFCSFAS